MKRLILTSGTGTPFVRSDFADLAVIFTSRFVWGPLPSPDELASYLAARSDRHAPGGHWSDFSDWRRTSKARKHLGLVEFCQDCETVELWFDPSPNAQLQLIWLLDYFRSYPATVVKLKLRLVNDRLTTMTPEELSRLQVPDVDVTDDELETASAVWQAYCATTPEACFDLLRRDLSALQLLRPALVDLLAELPSATTGLGATEMRMLEMVAEGHAGTFPSSAPATDAYLW
jgi:hypothetical protein